MSELRRFLDMCSKLGLDTSSVERELSSQPPDFKEFGRRGGTEAARRMTPEERSRRARRAAASRWRREALG